MFFIKLSKQTKAKEKAELKYKLYFWNMTYGTANLQETHSLDYVEESWVITQVSNLQRILVYDTATLVSFYQYLNSHGIVFNINEMSRDWEKFPRIERGLFYAKELNRILLWKKISKLQTQHKKQDQLYSIWTLPIPRIVDINSPKPWLQHKIDYKPKYRLLFTYQSWRKFQYSRTLCLIRNKNLPGKTLFSYMWDVT